MTVDYSGQGQAVLGLVHPSNFAENCCTVLLLSLTLFPFGRETCHQPDSVLRDSLKVKIFQKTILSLKFKFQIQDSFLEYFFLEIRRFEKRIALFE